MNGKNDLSLAKSLWRTALISAVATLSSCTASNDEDKPIGFETIAELPAVITNLSTFDKPVNISGNLTKQITFDVSISENYASLSLLADDVLLVDNIDIPTVGEHRLKMIVKFPHAGLTYLRFVGRTTNITLTNVKIDDLVTDIQQVTFRNISKELGLVTEDTLKYGGPSIGDINNNGHYDFVLNNHNSVPTQLVTNNGDSTVTVERLFSYALDFHGSALGDYDNDGDLDIMVALGGANGTSPTSYALLNNNDGSFKDVSVASGITTPARGRSPRWADFDRDGDLDILLGNAKTPNYDGPVQLFYRNMGDGTFTQLRVAGIESQKAERVLITDFNGDQIQDIILYTPLTMWQGNGDFTFTDVTDSRLPVDVRQLSGVNAITDVDVNNDGALDLYLALGKTHYQLSKKSIDFNPVNGELNVHDDGETGTTLINFTAGDPITLSDLNLTYRQWNGNYPIFLGKNKTRHVVKATGFQPTQLPAEMANANDTLVIDSTNADGWSNSRKVNGLYIGHTAEGNWKAEWVRDQNIYWNVGFTLTTLNNVTYDWKPNNRNGQDILLINQGDKFKTADNQWNLPKGGDHWGVTHGDFNNDGWNDLFVYRYGFLKERISDLLLLNTGDNSFVTTHMHGALDPDDKGHGDMGQAFDFDKNGTVDLLNGSEEGGHWYVWKNETTSNNHYLLVDVGYSPLSNVDSIGATIIITLKSGDVIQKRVGSAGEIFSASVIDTVHFGLAQETHVASVQVKWRNGESITILEQSTNQIISTDDVSN